MTKRKLSLGRYRVAAAAQLIGLSPHTLRVWERRYGPFASLRSPGGNRLYGESDVERLRLLKRLVDSGHAIGTVAPLATSELLRREETIPGELSAAAVTRAALRGLVNAVRALDIQAADDLLARASLALPPRELIEAVVAPLLQQVGAGWAAGTLDVAHEHALSGVLRSQLGGLLRALRPAPNAPAVIIATPEGELHELGALGAALVAAGLGYRAVYLGPSVPAADIAATVEKTAACAVLLSCNCAPRLRPAVAAVRRAVDARVAVIAGGSSAPADLGGVEPLALADLDDRLRRAARATA